MLDAETLKELAELKSLLKKTSHERANLAFQERITEKYADKLANTFARP